MMSSANVNKLNVILWFTRTLIFYGVSLSEICSGYWRADKNELFKMHIDSTT